MQPPRKLERTREARMLGFAQCMPHRRRKIRVDEQGGAGQALSAARRRRGRGGGDLLGRCLRRVTMFSGGPYPAGCEAVAAAQLAFNSSDRRPSLRRSFVKDAPQGRMRRTSTMARPENTVDHDNRRRAGHRRGHRPPPRRRRRRGRHRRPQRRPGESGGRKSSKAEGAAERDRRAGRRGRPPPGAGG